MTDEKLTKLLEYLISFPSETEWLEFKQNNFNPEELGEYISALSNSACLYDQPRGYLVFGIEDETKKVVGTTFNPRTQKIKGQELFSWLDSNIHPGVESAFHTFNYHGTRMVLVEVWAAIGYPVRFKNEAYIRLGSYKKKLRDHSGKEKELWEKLAKKDFESQLAAENISRQEVFSLLDYPSIFDSLKIPLPVDAEKIILKLVEENLISRRGELFNITNLGAILFAKKLNDFEYLNRKSVRVITYKNTDRNETIKEQVGVKGYAAGFKGLMRYLIEQIPSNEVVMQAVRQDTKMYPPIVIRELLANALIHQDFSIRGTSPTVEIFPDRVEFSNPGKPLINVLRFLDHTPRSRNEKIAQIMRRVGICEERGSGIDKVISFVELYQLPAPDFRTGDGFMRAIVYSHRPLNKMGHKEKVRATYQHACLKYVSGDQMTNESLRKRFNIDTTNYPMASRIIAEAIDEGFVKSHDSESKSRKFARYVPFWA